MEEKDNGKEKIIVAIFIATIFIVAKVCCKTIFKIIEWKFIKKSLL